MLILKNLKAGNSSSKKGEMPFQQEYTVARRKMVDSLRAKGIRDERVLEVMARVPRHRFVEEALITQAYQDSALNIGFGQTISQPYTVALLAQSLHLKGDESILEIGTGCGYQTSILAGLCRQIYTIERLHNLLLKARANLKRLEIKNVILKYGDGSQGWKDRAPFDAIVAAAVSPQVPKPLMDQLLEGGRLVVPIARDGKQQLVCVTQEGSRFHEEVIEDCRFVKMVGKHAFNDPNNAAKRDHLGREIYKTRGTHSTPLADRSSMPRRRSQS